MMTTVNKSEQQTTAWFDYESGADSRVPGSRLRAGLDAVRDYLRCRRSKSTTGSQTVVRFVGKIEAVEKNQQVIPGAVTERRELV